MPKRHKFTVEQYVHKAERCLANANVELAIQFLRRALEQSPENLDVLDMLGEVCFDAGHLDVAHDVFMQSVQLAPQHNGGKYMSLGQMTSGQAAVELYQKGIEVFQAEHARIMCGEEEGDANALQKQIASAFTTLAEVYLTDECFAENADTCCEHNLRKALEIDPGNLEATQAMASLRLNQGNRDAAGPLIDQVIAVYEHLEEEEQPDFQFRFETVKLLLELERYDDATAVLETLENEDDENVEILYLLGVCYFNTNHPHGAVDTLRRCKEHLVKYYSEEQEFAAKVDELLASSEAADACDEDGDDGDDSENDDDDDMRDESNS